MCNTSKSSSLKVKNWFVISTGNDGDRVINGVWLGLTDRDRESVYSWTDGTPVTYTLWAKGEPLNDQYNDDCVYFDANVSLWIWNYFRIWIWSVLWCGVQFFSIYGSETWTLKTADVKRLENFEMWVWRWTGKIRWTERVSNDEVLRKVGEERMLIKTCKERQKVDIGHILRYDGLMQHVIEAFEGRLEGKRPRGRKRIMMLNSIKDREPYQRVKERAKDS